jgi:hypothetical protein
MITKQQTIRIAYFGGHGHIRVKLNKEPLWLIVARHSDAVFRCWTPSPWTAICNAPLGERV